MLFLEGCRNQLRKDGKLHSGMHGIQSFFEEDYAQLLQPSHHDALTGEKLNEEESAVAERVFNVQGKEEMFKDSVTGQPLEQVLVKAARKLEMKYFEEKRFGKDDLELKHLHEQAKRQSPPGGSIPTRVAMRRPTTA